MLEPISAQTYTIFKLMRSMLEEHGSGSTGSERLNVYVRDMLALPKSSASPDTSSRAARPRAP
jgi:hypothetical protein